MLDEEAKLATKFRRSIGYMLCFQLCVFVFSLITAAITGVWTGTWYIGILGLIVIFLGLYGARKRSSGLLLFYIVIMTVYAIWNAIYIILLIVTIPVLVDCDGKDGESDAGSSSSECENTSGESWETLTALVAVTAVLSAIFWVLVVHSVIAASRLRKLVKTMEYAHIGAQPHNEHVVIITSNPQPVQPTTVVYQPYQPQPYAPQPYPQTQPYAPQGQPYGAQPYNAPPQYGATQPAAPQPYYPSGPYYDANAPN